jgi:hypothetical protein
MRIVTLAIGVLVAVAAGRAEEPAAIVEKAIQATATSELRLHRLKTVKRFERGTMYGLPGGDWSVERVTSCALPDQIKHDAMVSVSGQKQSLIMAVNGTSGWQQSNGQLQEFKPSEAELMKDEDLEGWALISLRPLREAGAKLKPLPAATINGKQAVGVNLARSGRPDAQYYFDPITCLPLRVTFKLREDSADSRQVDLDAYRPFDGIRLPTKITISKNGRTIQEWTVQDYKFPDRLDAKVFAKPK